MVDKPTLEFTTWTDVIREPQDAFDLIEELRAKLGQPVKPLCLHCRYYRSHNPERGICHTGVYQLNGVDTLNGLMVHNQFFCKHFTPKPI